MYAKQKQSIYDKTTNLVTIFNYVLDYKAGKNLNMYA